jgi:hypothetical protein
LSAHSESTRWLAFASICSRPSYSPLSKLKWGPSRFSPLLYSRSRPSYSPPSKPGRWPA